MQNLLFGLLVERPRQILGAKSSSKMLIFLTTFLGHIFLHFHLNKKLENIIFVGILRFLKWFGVNFLGFQLSYDSDI